MKQAPRLDEEREIFALRRNDGPGGGEPMDDVDQLLEGERRTGSGELAVKLGDGEGLVGPRKDADMGGFERPTLSTRHRHRGRFRLRRRRHGEAHRAPPASRYDELAQSVLRGGDHV
jgi:hypothetical protein